jgi:Na+-driven multidrug efflux pump
VQQILFSMQLIQSIMPSSLSVDGETNFFQRMLPLLRSIFFLAVPTFFTILLENAIPVVTTVMIGGLGEKFLAAGLDC